MSPGFDSLEAALADRYRIERELGRGGMAVVYLATDLKHDRRVAIKVLKPELAAVIGADRFLAEIRTTANLQHPNILPLFDSGQADSVLYFVMPYVEGETLRERLDREKQLSVDDAVRIARDVAEALDHAHARGVIHRDIKPANILLRDGRALVADFGVALAVREAGGERLTETGTSLGTPHYMSPEQASAEPHITGRSDLYSLGAVLYEMLAGVPPHAGPTSRAVLTRILTEEPRPVTETRRSVPPHVAAAVAKSLEKLPADRFDTGAELAGALADPAFRWPVEAAGARPAAHRGAIVAAFAALAALAAWGWLRPERADPVDPHVLRAEVSLPSGVSLALTGGFRYPIAISPDGRRMVFVGQEGRESRLYLREGDELMARPIRGTEGARQPFFSPNGDAVGFFAGTELQRVALAGDGPPTRVADVPPFSSSDGNWFGGSWGEDETVLYSLGASLWRVPADGSRAPEEIRLVLAAEDGLSGSSAESEIPVPIKWPRLLPGERYALLAVGWEDQSGVTGVVDLTDGGFRPLIVGGEPHYLPTGHLLLASGEERVIVVGFDLERRQVTSLPRTVLEGVARGPGGGATNFAVSRNGRLAYAPGGFDRRLAVVDRNGREDLLDVGPRGYRFPALAPDGRTLALTVDPRPSETWIVDVTSQTEQPFLTGESHHVQPEWSPSGSRLAIGTGREIFLVDWPGDGTRDPLGIQGEHSWVDDSTLVHVQANDANGRDLHLFDLASRTSSPLLQLPGDQFQPQVSPDGEWVAFMGDQTGTFEVYVTGVTGSGRPIPISRGGGEDPVWSARGDELFYRSGTWIVAVGIRSEPDFEITAPPDSLFPAPYLFNQVGNWEVLPDGNFIMIKGDPSIGRRLVLVTNWFEELSDR